MSGRFSTGGSAECHLAVRLKMDSYRGEDRCVTDMTSGIKLLQSQCHTSAWTVSLHHKESQYKNIEYSSLWWRNHRLFWFHFCEDSRLNPPALMGHLFILIHPLIFCFNAAEFTIQFSSIISFRLCCWTADKVIVFKAGSQQKCNQ